MSTEKHDEEAIRALFEEAHGSQPPPAFQSLWPAAAPRRRRHLLHFAVPASALAGALALVLTLMTPWERSGTGTADSRLADVTSVATPPWQGPLDFLLRTPGYDFLESVPGPSTTLGADSSEIFTETFEENLP